jgi:hypothetical protein
MELRNDKIVEYKAIPSRSFHVKSRAAQPEPTNILISADEDVQRCGRRYGVGVLSAVEKPATLEHSYYYETELDKLIQMNGINKKSEAMGYPSKYLLLGHGGDTPHNYLYFAQAPLPTREQHPNPAKPKKDLQFQLPPDTDELIISADWYGKLAEWTDPATMGDQQSSRNSAMGDISALNYAKSVFDEAWASERRWEWLHIVGSALGGNNEKGNLVAGTFDANTQMIPHERCIRELTQTATQSNPVKARFEVALYPNTWIAIEIKMTYGTESGKVAEARIPATTTLCFDRLQYDLWSM